MKYDAVLLKAWRMLWHYPALWMFGAILALVGANTIYLDPRVDRETNDQWINIKLTDTAAIRVPGADSTIDFTAPEGVRIITDDGMSWPEFRDLVERLNREASINLWPILFEFAAILVGLVLMGVIARYAVETSVICMVYEAEEAGRHLGILEGLRKGLSP